ncbi:MAG: hypothetical protein WCK98_07435 [bacterium]
MEQAHSKVEIKVDPGGLSLYFLIAARFVREQDQKGLDAQSHEIARLIASELPLHTFPGRLFYDRIKILLIIQALETFIQELEKYLEGANTLLPNQIKTIDTLIQGGREIQQKFQESLGKQQT